MQAFAQNGDSIDHSQEVYEAGWGCQRAVNGKVPSEVYLHRCQRMIHAHQIRPDATESTIRAHENGKLALRYFQSRFGWSGMDGKGMPLVSVTHIGHNYSGAYFDPTLLFIAYGSGDEVSTTDATWAIDITGHEFTHGVIHHTSQLAIHGEAGSIGEAYADFFGLRIEGKGDWIIGENMYLPDSPVSAIRTLKNPHLISFRYKNPITGVITTRKHPKNRSELLPVRPPCLMGTNFNCYAHVNSTALGHTFYLLSNQIGTYQTEEILFYTMTRLLRSDSDFNHHGEMIRLACEHLYKKGSKTCEGLEEVLQTQGF